jgi:hypothetical protein
MLTWLLSGTVFVFVRRMHLHLLMTIISPSVSAPHRLTRQEIGTIIGFQSIIEMLYIYIYV